MQIIETGFDGLYILQPRIFTDSRGYFFESYKLETFLKAGIPFHPVQDNESKSAKGVIRGLHYQLEPFAQTKLIRVVVGKIFDVAVDIRQHSKTYGRWFGIELDSENKTQFFIPKGFAHGFSVLSEVAVIQYKCDNLYSPQSERGISISDPYLGIDWKLGEIEPTISDKDLRHPGFLDAEKNF
ncbi:MAG TPA: dTDP-4-dehydrorhamnose 3,5-epimerase [Bacteroidales bacterium]|nr:dTDP-4-dehydrorhamnose 3,5-epimerase [Bacteroidales bacterium]